MLTWMKALDCDVCWWFTDGVSHGFPGQIRFHNRHSIRLHPLVAVSYPQSPLNLCVSDKKQTRYCHHILPSHTRRGVSIPALPQSCIYQPNEAYPQRSGLERRPTWHSIRPRALHLSLVRSSSTLIFPSLTNLASISLTQ